MYFFCADYRSEIRFVISHTVSMEQVQLLVDSTYGQQVYRRIRVDNPT